MADTIAIRLTTLKCVKPTLGEIGADEPYVVTFTAFFGGLLPMGIANVTQVVQGMNRGDEHTFRPGVPLWGVRDLAASPQPIVDPTQVIILIAVMENDGVPSVNMVRALCQASMVGSLLGLPRDRPGRVAALRDKMTDALKTGASTGGLHTDDLIGNVHELDVHQRDLDRLAIGQRELRTIHVVSTDPGIPTPPGLDLRPQYDVTIEITRHAAPL
jgi:hypothetical protein